MSDPWQDPSAKAWMRHVITDMVPKVEKSEAVISIAPSDGGEGDVKFWVELGASIMMDKPIVVVVFHDQEVPAKLAAVADEIVRCERGVNPAASEALAAAIKRVVGDHD